MPSNPIGTSATADQVDIEIGDFEDDPHVPRLTEEYLAASSKLGKVEFTKREWMYQFLNSVQFQSLILLLVLTDVGILIFEVSDRSETESVTLARVTLWILLAFGVEIVLKILIYSPYLFVKDPFNIFDSAVVFLSLVLTVAELAMAGKSMAVLRAARTLYRVVKALRTIRSLRFLAKSLTSSKAAARHVTGRNKQRYVDLANQIDLDLCYVNDDQNLIVMSVPATGRLALFRNPLPEVRRFFQLKHPDHHRIYNCCPEHPYDGLGTGCEIVKYAVQDHSPPTLQDFVSFLNDAASFMGQSNENAIAVHCRGGKGRSGVMCCAWLLYTKECATADQAMAKFALSRTEMRTHGKLQGVETPSQKRYVYQVDQLLKKQNRYFTSPETTVSMPSPKTLKLQNLVLERLFSAPANLAKDGPLVCVVKCNNKVVLESQPLLHELLTDKPVFGLEGVEVSGDVCIAVFQKSKMKQEEEGVTKSGKEKGVLFMFFFHTAFTTGGEMRVGLKMLDKAVKNKRVGGIQKPYNVEGGVLLHF